MGGDVTRRFREARRAERAGVRYHGWAHFFFTETVCVGVFAYAVLRVEAPSALELLTLPLGFLFANVVEYMGHRYPMHHPVRPLERLFRRHTREHHAFFTAEGMGPDSHQDFFFVLFPPVLLAFFLGAIATPLALLLFAVASANVGWLFVVVASGYFGLYEVLHFTWHQAEGSRVFRLPGIHFLREHHRRHHDPALMSRWNFNITFPITDVVMGTRWTPQRALGPITGTTPPPPP